MRFVIFGAGAIGGVIAARLAQHGHEVGLVARGAHLDAIRERGLRLEAPDGTETLRLPAADHPAALDLTAEDVVLLCVKSQQSVAALNAVAQSAPPQTPVVCVQNGVQNERAALRRFANVYAVCVVCPALHLEPGVVCAYGAPVTGILDIGRYPAGVDATAESVAVTFNRSTFESVTRPDIMRWKYTKLVRNLGNAIEAVCGPEARGGPLSDLVTAEAEACLRAAGIDAVPLAEDDARRGDVMPWGGPRARGRPGGSSWQSLTRATGSIETDYLNGEIVLLGRLHGVPTPANELLQDLANAAARAASPPGAVPAQDVLGRLGLT